MHFFAIALLAVTAQSVQAQDDAIRKDVEERKTFVVGYLEETVEMDENTRRMASAMIDVYIQSIVRTSKQMPLNDRTKQVYVEIKKNHLQLLGGFLTEDQLETYQLALMQDKEGSAVCIYCDFPRKKDFERCMFCGNIFGDW